MKTILITAYSVNPFKGSEDGTGWNITREIAKKYKVILITRKNNVPHIDKYKKENNDAILDNISFYGYDLPQPILWLKKKLGERGYVLYFYFWQLFVTFFIKKQAFKFDITHSLNFHSDSQPQFLWLLGKPTFWGPIGHHSTVPKSYLFPIYGLKNYTIDRLYNTVKWMLRNLDPFFHLAVYKSEKIFAINSSVAKVIGISNHKITVLPAVASKIIRKSLKTNTSSFTILSVGRFHYMKGFDITIRAFAKFYQQLNLQQKKQVKLVLVGKGEEKKRLQNIAISEKIGHKIEWVNWVSRKEMEAIYQKADAFLFPSHEGAGMVVPEAMSYEIPVLCFDNEGPGELVGDCGIKIKYTTYHQTIINFSNELINLFENKNLRSSIAQQGKERHRALFTWQNKGKVITNAYQNVLQKKPKAQKTIAVFHPSSELYGADRILVNALNAIPKSVIKRVYLKSEGPLIEFINANVTNVEIIVKNDMPVIYRKIFTPFGLLTFVWNWFRFVFFLNKENKEYHFKSAYVNTLSCSFILPLLRKLKIPNYIHVHEIIESPKLIGKITSLFSYWFSNRIVCVSQAVLDSMQLYVPPIVKKAIVLHNGINKITTEKNNKNKSINFYLFGRIMHKKGQWYLLEALAKIRKKALKNTKFILMGGVLKGQEHLTDELREKIMELGLGEYVKIKNFSANIESAMSDADVCLVPSMMKDPFPTTVLEAMSAGKPVIATNHGGAKEAIVDGESGFLVSPNNPKNLADSILYLITNREQLLQIGEKAHQRFQQKFTLQHFNQKWGELNITNNFV